MLAAHLKAVEGVGLLIRGVVYVDDRREEDHRLEHLPVAPVLHAHKVRRAPLVTRLGNLERGDSSEEVLQRVYICSKTRR